MIAEPVTPEMKTRIDNMTREQMAAKWRFAPPGDPMFQGEAGDYFAQVFRARGGMSPEISKWLGW